MRVTVVCLVALAALSTSASAQTLPAFTNGALVARKMEAHYNGTTYKAKLAKIGARLTTRVLCAHDAALRLVECNGKASIRDSLGKRYRVSVQWELQKLAPKRARLRWTMRGNGAFDSQREIVAPSAFNLSRF